MIAIVLFGFIAFAFALGDGWIELKWAWAPERRSRLFRRARLIGPEADLSGGERATLASSTRHLLVAAFVASLLCVVIPPFVVVTVLAPLGFGSAWRLERHRVTRGDAWLMGALGTCGVLAVLPAALPAGLIGGDSGGLAWLVLVLLLGTPAMGFLAIARQYSVACWFDREARRSLVASGRAADANF